MTIQDAAKTALQIQDACNLSGVIHSFPEIMETIWTEARRVNAGTNWVNRHPIVTVFLDKLASLNDSECLCSDHYAHVQSSFDLVRKLADGITSDNPNYYVLDSE
jgi:hypothetical protein